MALLYCPQFIAFDENGDPASGALLYTYDSVATSTPKTTYSDSGRTVAHTNPVVANAYGVFPQIYGDEGEGYYCVLKDADGNTLDEFQAVQMLGQDASSVFLRDFALNGRLKGYGEAGVVNLEFMPPEGDDTGGSGRIGGAAGTQGEEMEIDFADVTVTGDVAVSGGLTVTGDLSVSGATQFAQVLSTTALSAASTVDIELPDEYEAWEIQLRNLTWTSNGAELNATISFDDAGSFKTGASDYAWQRSQYAATTASADNSTGAASFRVTCTLTGTTARSSNAVMRVHSKSGVYAAVMSNFLHIYNTNNMVHGQASAFVTSSSYGKATHLRLAPSAGTITGDVVVYGLPKAS